MKVKKFRTTVFTLLLAMCMIISIPFPALAVDTIDPPETSLPEVRVTPVDDLFDSRNTTESVRYLALRVMLDETYREDYSNAVSEATTRVAYVDYPFINTWSIGFTESFVNVGPLAIGYCERSITLPCTDAICGSGCNNDINDLIHHKNSIKNLNRVRTYISDEGYDIMLTLVSTPMCGIWDNEHSTNNILGVTYPNDNYTLLSNASTISTNVRVRIMQHEICHMFGCHDGVCTSGADCIMNGGYDGVSLYTADVWCSSCREDFNPNTH